MGLGVVGLGIDFIDYVTGIGKRCVSRGGNYRVARKMHFV